MQAQNDSPASIPRLATGISGLDTLLFGGLLRGSICVISGGPGTGKTVLSNQMAFHLAAAGERTVYVSMLAESHSRLISHFSTFPFFHKEWIPERVTYLSAFPTLEREGLEGLLHVLHKSVREAKASLLVIDSLSSLCDFASSDLALKRLFRQLGSFCELTGCTALLVTQSNQPEATLASISADCILELSRLQKDLRTVRQIEVHKLRGSELLPGRHFFSISRTGVTVYPRIESLPTGSTATEPPLERRLGLGIQRLDEMLNGGLIAGSTTVLLGAPGSGKTLVGTHFLAEGARQGEPGLYFGFYEQPSRLLAKARGIGLDLESHAQAGRLELLWQPALEYVLDELAGRLLAAVQRRKVRRLFIDGLDGFIQSAVLSERLSRFLAALNQELGKSGVTTVISEESNLLGPDIHVPLASLSASYENIIMLRYVELHAKLRRLLSIIKTRESGYDPSLREFRITSNGIEVEATFESAEDVLSGLARVPPNRKPPPAGGQANG